MLPALSVVYLIIGLVIGIPYCLLAGWSVLNVPWAVALSPAFLLAWLIIAGMTGVAGIRRYENGWSRLYINWRAAFSRGDTYSVPGFRMIFWLWSAYCLLPIILRWNAALASNLGYETVGAALYTNRYASIGYVAVAALVIVIVIGLAEDARTLITLIRSKFARPAGR